MRTYLALSSDALDGGRLEVVAFPTVAIAVTDYTAIGLDRRLQIMGRVPGVRTANFLPGYLVAIEDVNSWVGDGVDSYERLVYLSRSMSHAKLESTRR